MSREYMSQPASYGVRSVIQARSQCSLDAFSPIPPLRLKSEPALPIGSGSG